MKPKEWPVECKLSFLERSINQIEKEPHGYHFLCWKYSIRKFKKLIRTEDKNLDGVAILSSMKECFPELLNVIKKLQIDYPLVIPNYARLCSLRELQTLLSQRT